LNNIRVNVNGELSTGMYLIKASFGSRNYCKKWIVTR